MKKLILLLLLYINASFVFGQVEQCSNKNCKLFSIVNGTNKITFTNISDKMVWAVGFCETVDGDWETDYENFVPIFPKAQEDISNLQYSCQCIRPTHKKLLTGNYIIFYYYSGETASLSINQMKALCKQNIDLVEYRLQKSLKPGA
jgi:hypothetical protein